MLFWGFNNISDTKMVSFYVILLRNGFNFCSVHGIMIIQVSCKVSEAQQYLCKRPEVFMIP